MSRHHHAATTRWTRRALLGAGVASAGAVTLSSRTGATEAPPASPTPDTASGFGFASPDEALDAYLTAMAAADFDGAVAAFALEPYVEHFDFAGNLRRLGFYLATNTLQPLPNTDPFNAAINLAARRADVSGQITNQYFALVKPDLDRSARGQRIDDDNGGAEEFIASLQEAMTPAPLADLASYELVPIDRLDAEAAETLASEDFIAHDEQLLATTGADESAELAASSAVGGAAVALLVRAVRYGDAWWLESLGGQISRLLDLDYLSAGVMWLDGAPDGSDPSAASAPATTG